MLESVSPVVVIMINEITTVLMVMVLLQCLTVILENIDLISSVQSVS